MININSYIYTVEELCVLLTLHSVILLALQRNTLPQQLKQKQYYGQSIASLNPGSAGGKFVSHGTKLRVSACILPRELRWISKWIYGLQMPYDQERYLSKSAEQTSESGYGLQTVT